MTLPYVLETTRPLQLGLVVLQADETLERDMRRLLPPDVEVLVTRVPSGPVVSSDSLREMGPVLTGAAALLPRGADCAVVGYGCTSGTAEIGVAQIAKLVQAGVATPAVTEPVSALIAACAHLGVTRIGMVSPYVESVSARLRAVLHDAGISVVAFTSFDEANEERVVRIASGSTYDAGCAMGENAACEAVFLSCTNLRTLDVIDAIEQQIGKPVLSSNQVLAWHMLRVTGREMPADAPGRLCQA